MPSVSIVIPAYNEESRLPATLSAVLKYLCSRSFSDWEILVVDDGSSDGTATEVERRHAGEPRIRLLRNPGNRGKGYSVRHGMLEAGLEWILFTDADLSAPVEELDRLLDAVQSGETAIAIGSRALNRSLIAVHQSSFRETAGRIFNLLMRVLTGLPFADTQCGFKLFRHDAAGAIFSRQRINRWGFDAEALFLGRTLGFQIVEVPVRWSHCEGTKVHMFRDSANMFLDLLRIRWNQLRGAYR